MGGTSGAGSGGDRDDQGRRRFGRSLAEALKTRGMKQEHLAAMLGTTQSSVSGWINGKYEPAAETVFRIEQSLGLEPGRLSRPLGYLPVDAPAGAVSVEGAIVESTLLDDDQKAALLAVYHVLVERGEPPAGAERPPPAASTPSRARLTAGRTTAARPRRVAGNR